MLMFKKIVKWIASHIKFCIFGVSIMSILFLKIPHLDNQLIKLTTYARREFSCEKIVPAQRCHV